MAGKIKIIPTSFLVYDYDREEETLNNMSLKGWQLKKAGLLHHTYIQDDQVYRYKLDYNNKIHLNREEADRYLSIFGDQGWELVNSTINGWHYFRKKFDPTKDEKEYEIYTDDNSLMDMLGKWIRNARVFQAIFALFTLIYLIMYREIGSSVHFAEAIMLAIGAVFMELCVRNLKKKRVLDKPKSKKSEFIGYGVGVIFLLLLLTTLVLLFYQPNVYKLNYSTEISQDTPDLTDDLEVKKTGNYILNVKCKSEEYLVNVQLLKNGHVIYNSGDGGDFEYRSPKLKLKAGSYTVKVIYHPMLYEQEDVDIGNEEEDNSRQSISDTGSVDISLSLKRALH